jgi:hypothetical protein
LRASFTELSTYAGCPLKYRYLHVDGRQEPEVEPDWSHAPQGAVDLAPLRYDRLLGEAVHAALRRWQADVDRGTRARPDDLVRAVLEAARLVGLDPEESDRTWPALASGLRAYAVGPWPARHTIYLEHSAMHRIADANGHELQLHLRADRITSFDGGIAIIDFKTVPPHALQLRADTWQLRTYAIAAEELVGFRPHGIRLSLIDLRSNAETEIASGAAQLRLAHKQILAAWSGIAARRFSVARGHRDRPCWSCGFRLECRHSLATARPAVA